jgi:hypothetical protein
MNSQQIRAFCSAASFVQSPGDLIAQVSAQFGFKKHLDRVME